MKIDMHIHSNYSDGSLSPQEIVDVALKNKVSYISLTDHDTIDGISDFKTASKLKNIKITPGVEISTKYKRTHILGYNFLDLKTMKQELDKYAKQNHNICLKIIYDMKEDGIFISRYALKTISGDRYLTLKTLAKALVFEGIVKTEVEAFEKYLSYNKLYYYDLIKMSTKEAIKLITECGGIPVLAHPYYSFFKDLSYEINELILKGIKGIEVYYGLHNLEQKEFLRRVAIEKNLIMTIGSDFHKFNGKGRNIGLEMDYNTFYNSQLNKIY